MLDANQMQVAVNVHSVNAIVNLQLIMLRLLVFTPMIFMLSGLQTDGTQKDNASKVAVDRTILNAVEEIMHHT